MRKNVDCEEEAQSHPSFGSGQDGRFRSLSYIERQAEKFGVTDDESASRQVASALQAKHDAAELKRKQNVSAIKTTNAERVSTVLPYLHTSKTYFNLLCHLSAASDSVDATVALLHILTTSPLLQS
jgi:hypothetical protein